MNFFLVILFTSTFLLTGCLRRSQEFNPTVISCPVQIGFSLTAEPIEKMAQTKTKTKTKKPSSSSIRCKPGIVASKKISTPTPLSTNTAKINRDFQGKVKKDISSEPQNNNSSEIQEDSSSKSENIPVPIQIQTTPVVEVSKSPNIEEAQKQISSAPSSVPTVSLISTSSSTDDIISTPIKDVLPKDSSVASAKDPATTSNPSDVDNIEPSAVLEEGVSDKLDNKQ